MNGGLHPVLDEHLEALRQAGSSIHALLSSETAPNRAAVEDQIAAAGYAVRSEVVDFFTWRGVATLTEFMAVKQDFFPENTYPISVDGALRFQACNRQVFLDAGMSEADLEDTCAAARLLPVLRLDSDQWASVDCSLGGSGGALVQCYGSGGSYELAPSLMVAFRDATAALATGQLRLEGGQIVGVTDRT
ncbi:MAG: hypothetical protein AAF567_26525 [Actinomycetota bacterium]